MNATIDSYLQVRVMLTDEDIARLERERKLRGRVWHTYRDAPGKEFPFRIYLCDRDMPRDDELGPFRDSATWGYEIYLGKQRLREIKQKKIVGGVSPRKWLRMCYVSHIHWRG